MKYSAAFERDYSWYLKWKDEFDFDGTYQYVNKKGDSLIIPDVSGYSAKDCFYKYDSEGIILPCKEPELLMQLYRCKGSINLHIKMWAEDRAKGILPLVEFDKSRTNDTSDIKYCMEWVDEKPVYYQDYKTRFELLDWMVDAVEKQKYKYYD